VGIVQILLGQLQRLVQAGDLCSVSEQVEGVAGQDDDAAAVWKRYAELANDLYWKAKDLTAAVKVSQLGIDYCLGKSALYAAEQRDALRGQAKALAFNLASFAWPGWAEPGITIDDTHLAAGRDAAKLNLQLAIELNRPAKPMSNAHWMVGAYAIVDRQFDEAVAAFERAAAFNQTAKDDAAAAMNRAYAVLARLAAAPHDPAFQAAFNSSLDAIRQTKADDASFYVEQLQTARQVFATAPLT
jgi:hypothetical protein